MQMPDCWEIEQCMTDFTTTRLLCYQMMTIRELERKKLLMIRCVLVFQCMLHVLCEGLGSF